MKHVVLIALFIGAFTTDCQASDSDKASQPTSSEKKTEAAPTGQALRDEIFERTKKRRGGGEPTQLDLLNELMQKGAEQAGAVKDFGKMRVITRGAKPEIIIQETLITYNGKELRVGDSLARWKKVLPPGPRCSKEITGPVLCVWPSLAIDVGTNHRDRARVKYFSIHLNLEPADPLFPQASSLDLPIHAFPGYLELDGYGIDSHTKFWEIRASVDPKRNLRCNPRDCSHPHGGFSDTANLYLRLNSGSEYGNLYEFSISADDVAEATSKK